MPKLNFVTTRLSWNLRKAIDHPLFEYYPFIAYLICGSLIITNKKRTNNRECVCVCDHISSNISWPSVTHNFNVGNLNMLCNCI